MLLLELAKQALGNIQGRLVAEWRLQKHAEERDGDAYELVAGPDSKGSGLPVAGCLAQNGVNPIDDFAGHVDGLVRTATHVDFLGCAARLAGPDRAAPSLVRHEFYRFIAAKLGIENHSEVMDWTSTGLIATALLGGGGLAGLAAWRGQSLRSLDIAADIAVKIEGLKSPDFKPLLKAALLQDLGRARHQNEVRWAFANAIFWLFLFSVVFAGKDLFHRSSLGFLVLVGTLTMVWFSLRPVLSGTSLDAQTRARVRAKREQVLERWSGYKPFSTQAEERKFNDRLDREERGRHYWAQHPNLRITFMFALSAISVLWLGITYFLL